MGTAKTTVRRTSTAEAVFEHLMQRIRSRELKPGDWLPSERQMQEDLGVGRLALREGLARMSALGVIRVEHGKGACIQENVDGQAIANALMPLVPERDTKTLQDLVAARSLVEGELAALAAERRTDDDVARLQAMLAEPSEGLADQALADMDAEFHREVARIADNAFLTIMLDALRGHIRSFLLHYVRATRDRTSVVERHRPILKAIIERDAAEARTATRAHIDLCQSSLKAYVEKSNG
jgi:GntR family transcriptional regulator, transcriptional repressor for pyruvate dehydrogenase complex